MAQKPKVKRTHRYSEEQQQQFMAYAKEHGDSNDTTKAMERKFDIPQRVAYYYRRKAFGYRNDQRLPVRIQVQAEVVEALKWLMKLYEHPDFSAAIRHLIAVMPIPFEPRENPKLTNYEHFMKFMKLFTDQLIK